MPLQRTSSRLDLLGNSMNLDTRATKPSDAESMAKGGLKRSSSRPNLLDNNTPPPADFTPNLGLRRTSSRVNLDDESPVGSSAQKLGKSPFSSSTNLLGKSPRNSSTNLLGKSPSGSSTNLLVKSPLGSSTDMLGRSPRGSSANLLGRSPRGSSANLLGISPRNSSTNLSGKSPLGSSANLRDLANRPPPNLPNAPQFGRPASPNSANTTPEFRQTDDDKGGLMLRRTGSTMSITDLQPRLESSSEFQMPLRSDDSNIMSPPVSPGMPLLHRSHSLTQLETINPSVSEGQKAVESISGKVDLKNLQPEPSYRKSEAAPPIISPTSATATPPSLSPAHFTAYKLNVDRSAQPAPAPVPPEQQSSPSATFQLGTPSTSQPSTTNSSALKIPPPRKLTSLPSQHDDYDIKPDAGERVDYFSHNWNEGDIAGSWRYIISRRQDMANSARLENASWRMWAKAKYRLPTVDPAKINWLKDYDVTWLYGPLYHEFDEDKPPTPASAATVPTETPPEPANSTYPSALDKRTHPLPSSSAFSGPAQRIGDNVASHTNPSKPPVSHLKSILKKKTLAQMMLEEAHELDVQAHPPSASGHVRSTANYLRHHHYRPMPQGQSRRLVADILNQQYRQNRRHSGGDSEKSSSEKVSPRSSPGSSPHLEPVNEAELSFPHRVSNLPSPRGSPSLSPRASPRGSPLSSTTSSRQNSLISMVSRPHSLLSIRSDSGRSYEGRRVRFNDRVDQCIAVDPEVENAAPSENTSAAQPPKFSSAFDISATSEDSSEEEEDDDDDGGGLFLGLRRSSVLSQRAEDPNHQIIAALPATSLKYENSDDSEYSDDEGFVIMDMPTAASSRRPGLNAQYTPHPVQSYEIVDPEIQPVKFEYSEEGMS